MKLVEGSSAWLDIGHGYSVPVTIYNLNPLTVMANVTGQSVFVDDAARLSNRIPCNVHVDDLIDLQESSESIVLYSLQERFRNRRIYTGLSNQLLFVNPNERFPIYDEKVIKQFLEGNNEKSHIFAISRSAFHKIRDGSTNETIMFSGESGAGKSFNALQAMRFLASVAPSQRRQLTPKHMEALSTIFTSFASARTSKNDNATRFGYVAELLFKNCRLEGLNIRATLPLEISRVVGQKVGDRNFNVFYEMCAGMSSEQKSALGIKDDHKFFYMHQARQGDSTEDRDGENFTRLEGALDLLGFTEDQRSLIYKILASVLHIGNIYYRQRRMPDNSESVEIGNENEIRWTSLLLETDSNKWAANFVSRLIKTESGLAAHTMTIGQALDARDSIAQLVYEELFQWILTRISQFFKCPGHTAVINIVDYYGIERYASNGLQQLCINTVNEKMHSLFVKEVFRDPMTEYHNENVPCNYQIPHHLDNERVVELLIKKPYGLLPLLDDECKFPKASDKSYLQHANMNHLDKSVYGKARNKERCEFSVRHFSGNTWYLIHDYISANRRAVPIEAILSLSTSQNPVIASMFRSLSAGRDSGDYITYVALNFTHALHQIIDRLKGSNFHFVRCLRANNERTVAKFDLPTVSRQVKVLSVVESQTFRTVGFPVKVNLGDFATKYRCLLPEDIARHQKTMEIITDILTGQGSAYEKDFVIGQTHIFLRERLARRLELRRAEVTDSSVVLIQKCLRGMIARKAFIKKRDAALKIQSAYRGWKARRSCQEEMEKRLREIGKETRRNKRMMAYMELTSEDAKKADSVKKPIVSLGPVEYLDVSDDLRKTLDSPFGGKKIETRTIHHYFPIQPQLYRPNVQPVSIESFALEHFKGHLLEVRREPIVTPFLAKENDTQFQQSVDMFKLVLKYMNDSSLSSEKLQLLAKHIIQAAISNKFLRDELLVQLCNQTYGNRNKANADRGWTLILSALNSFPPSVVVLPMLLSYFSQQPLLLQTYLNEALLRKIKTVDQTVTRQYASNRLEQLASAALQTIAVNIHSSESEGVLVEAHPWATAEELAQRVLRQRGIANAEGWSISVEGDDKIYSPVGGQFIHDVICEIEGSAKGEKSAFYNYPPQRTLPQIGQRPESRQEQKINRVRCSPVEKRRDRSAPAYVRETLDDGKDGNIRPPVHPIRETYRDVENKESDYCYTLPNKNSTRARNLSGNDRNPSRQGNTLSRLDMQRNTSQRESQENDNEYEEDLYAPRAPSANTMRRYRQTQEEFVNDDPIYDQTMPVAYVPQNGMQYVPFVPVMMTPQMMHPLYGAIHGGVSRHDALPQSSRDFALPETPVGNDFEEQNPISRESRSRSRGMVQAVPSEYSGMSVASRIRRIPVPRENGDVDRFLDEVFEQVLTPHEYNQSDINPRKLAASIKGGYGKETGINRAPMNRVRDPSDDYDQDGYTYVERGTGGNCDNFYDVNNSSSNYYEMHDPPTDYPRGHSADPDNEQVYGTSQRCRSRNLSSKQSKIMSPEATTMRRTRHHSQPARNIMNTAGYPPMNQQMFMMMPMPTNGSQIMMDNSRAGSQMGMIQPMMMTPQMMFCMPPGSNTSCNTPLHIRQQMSYDDYDRTESPLPDFLAAESAHFTTLNRPQMRARYPSGSAHTPSNLAEERLENASKTPATARKAGLNRIPPEVYSDPIVQNQVSNSEHYNPNRIPGTGFNYVQEEKRKQHEALLLLDARTRMLPPPIDSVCVLRPRKEAVIVRPVSPPPPPRQPSPEFVTNQPEFSSPRTEWVFDGEVERSSATPKMISPVPPSTPREEQLPVRLEDIQQRAPVKQRPALTYAKQPWKLTIRKEMFYPNEPLDDVQVIDQVFAQIIEDCRRAIAYRIRSHERQAVVDQLKANNVPPELLNRQSDIPTPVKVKIIETARKWPLYFNQIYEVVEERPSENVSLLLGLGEYGLCLLFHTPQNKESPLKVQDHFDFTDIRDVIVQGCDLLKLRTTTGMSITLRTKQANHIRFQLEKCMSGEVRDRQFVEAATDYITKEANLLTFVKGDRIEIVPREGESPEGRGWLYGKIGNRYGNFPSEYVLPIDPRTGEAVPPTAVSPLPLPIDDIAIDDYNFDDGYEADEKTDKFTMMEFALKYFRGPKGETAKKNKEWTWKDVAEKVKWTDKHIPHSLLRLDSNEADKMAVDAFTYILKYMGDDLLKRGETLTDCIYRILLICRKFEPMRDEIYCQIIRQTTNNKSNKTESSIFGWRLFTIMTAFFDCSPVLRPYLMKYLSEMASDTRRAYHGTAQICLMNLAKTIKYGGRKVLLSPQEIEEITLGKFLKKQQFILPGGLKKVINIRAVTVAEEVIQELCNELNIRSPAEQQEFCLCYASKNDPSLTFAANDEYILDICTAMEQKHKSFTFVLRRAVWIHPLRLDNPMYINVMFFQLLPDYLDGLFCSTTPGGQLSASTMDDVAKLGALLFLSSQQKGNLVISPKNIVDLVPHTVIDRTVGPDQWASRVSRKLALLDKGMTEIQARASFLGILENWLLFGATLYRVIRVARGENPLECVLAISRHGVQILQKRSNATIQQWPFTQIINTNKFEMGSKEMLDLKLGSAASHVTITLQTERSSEITRLMGQYIFVDSSNRGLLDSSSD